MNRIRLSKTIQAGGGGWTYREYHPRKCLQASVACFWSLSSEGSPTESLSYRILPDGCVDIIFDHTQPQAGAVVTGAMSSCLTGKLEGHIDLLGVRFRPGGAFPILKSPLIALKNTSVPLAHLAVPVPDWLEEDPRRIGVASKRINILESWLTRELQSVLCESASHAAVARGVSAILWSGGTIKSRELAQRAGCSSRHLQRVFDERVGSSPKQLCRIVRLLHVLERRNMEPYDSWAALSYECGFADQSHLVNEFNSITGLTPLAYVSSIQQTANRCPFFAIPSCRDLVPSTHT